MAKTRLFKVHGSHPCETVEQALRLKGLDYGVVELVPPSHAPVMRAIFGKRTVPGLRFEDGKKVSGSRAILEELERRVPSHALFPADPAKRARVAEAERWGDDVFQPIARRLIWSAFHKRPEAMVGYQEGGKLPALPAPAIKLMAPLLTRVERKMNASTDAAVARDLAELPGHLDRIDGWLADGTLGALQTNAADLQIAPTLRLILTLGDVRVIAADRPCTAWARRQVPVWHGDVPSGVLR